MPGQSRLDAPVIVHHVMIHGIERCNIFRNNKDRDDFLERLTILITETGIFKVDRHERINHKKGCLSFSEFFEWQGRRILQF